MMIKFFSDPIDKIPENTQDMYVIKLSNKLL